MSTYILDTGVCVYIIKQKPLSIKKRLAKLSSKEIAISVLTLAELTSEATKLNDAPTTKLVNEFISKLSIIGLDAEDVKHYALFSLDGKNISQNDALTASQAKSLNATLVTLNANNYDFVKNLKIEEWQ